VAIRARAGCCEPMCDTAPSAGTCAGLNHSLHLWDMQTRLNLGCSIGDYVEHWE